MRTMKHLALAAMTASALALAGCGGGGSSSSGPVQITDPAATKLADARAAAMAAWHAARGALAGLAGKESANPVAYQRAMNAVADAMAAYEAAKAATTLADAETAKADAEAAQAEAMTFAGMVVAAYEAPALEAAQMAAKSAADAAKVAYDAAMAALTAVESIKGGDTASYDMAAAKVAAAKAAYDAAMAASDAAAAATALADAKAQQAAAESALENANTANTDAMKYAGMVQTAEDNALTDAQTAAQTAYGAAKVAYDAAKERVADLEAKKADNIEDYVRAMDALARVKSAYDSAMAANDMAQAATMSADAKTHQATVEAAGGTVVTETAGVAMYAGSVETAYTAAQAVRKAAADEADALADAKTAAMTAAVAAAKAAEDARMEADKVAAKLGADSVSALTAKAHADAADAAAKAAKEASDMAQAATTSADAIKYQRMAEGEQGKAETQLATATELARQAGVATAGLDQLRIEFAQGEAKDAKDAADKAAMAAREKANMADAQADAAEADAAMAMRARMDYANANKHAMAARMAADDAETAAKAAEAAVKMADAEYVKAMNAVTPEAARSARDMAREQRDIAMAKNTGDDGANAQYMAAMKAAGDAKKYAAMHVLGLLKMANAVSEMDADDRKAAMKAVAMAIGSAAGMPEAAVTDADNDSSTTDGSGATTVNAMWPADTPDDPDTNANEFVAGMLAINVAPDGSTARVFRTTAAEEDDVSTTDIDETVVTATKIDGLGMFMHGYSISGGGTHAIVFTDKKQGKAEVTEKTITLTNANVMLSRIMVTEGETPDGTVGDLGGSKSTYDHDGNPDTDAVTGAYSCSVTNGCSIQVTDGKITGVVGTGTLLFSTTGAQTIVAEAAAMENIDYLAFGVWLDEDDSANNGGSGNPQFAAFAGGGTTSETPATLTGKATYNGAATGVYTAGSSVDYFQARATLMADFGAIDTDPEKTAVPPADTSLGMISGTIDRIVAGGDSMSDVIKLNSAALTVDGGFAGNARMGPAMVKDNMATYDYNGHWGGQFYGPATDNMATTTVTEGPDNTAPAAAAGTFGVTGTMGEGDDAMTRSYVGAFGARR